MGAKKSIMVYLDDDVYDYVNKQENRSKYVNDLIKQNIPTSEKDYIKQELKQLTELENKIHLEINACENRAQYENGYYESPKKYYTINLPIDVYNDIKNKHQSVSNAITGILQDAGYGVYSRDKINSLTKELIRIDDKKTMLKLKLAEILKKEDQEMLEKQGILNITTENAVEV